jgi:hypothetical protein
MPAHLEIDEVPTGASLSTGTSPTIESTMSLNPRINPEKCEHPCKAEDLNPGGQVQPQGTEPTELDLVCLINHSLMGIAASTWVVIH